MIIDLEEAKKKKAVGDSMKIQIELKNSACSILNFN